MPQIRTFATPEALGTAVATDIAARLSAKHGPFLLGCPGGRSPRPVYAALAAMPDLDLSRLIIVMMDDYLTETAQGFAHVDANAHYSCRRFARVEIQGLLNANRPPHHQIPDAQVWFPDPANPAAYDTRIAASGGIDYFLLASGAGDGHVAFNPPGSAADSQTRILLLAEQTRRDNLATFPDFPDLDAVPRHGLTVGIATIARARATGMVVWGAGKRTAFTHLSQAKSYDPAWPATVWVTCPDATLYADHAAAGDAT
jgi:glucosamine-6-phosphate deaminase